MASVAERGEDGALRWRLKGTRALHRLDGPAVEFPDGTAEWWFFGNRVLKDELPGLRSALADYLRKNPPPGPDWSKAGPRLIWGANRPP
jgi:hypothetical protein